MPFDFPVTEAAYDSTPESGNRYDTIRWLTEELCGPLSPEDCVVQSMPDASPAKWHLAHTTWFFETFVLIPHQRGYEAFHPRFGYLFNSYYDTVGQRHPRPLRGLLTRPSLDEVFDYRAHVDAAMRELLAELQGRSDQEAADEIRQVIEIGLHHEQQHQELLLTDVKHLLSCNPLRPVYRTTADVSAMAVQPPRFVAFAEGLSAFGRHGLAGRCDEAAGGDGGFCYDNEQPRHKAYLQPFALADRPVTNGEWKAFLTERGYERPELWLAEGWAAVGLHRWTAPLYWERDGDDWQTFTLSGMRPVADAEPVCHISFYEADAFARWSGKRLPTEFEWEHACGDRPVTGNLLDSRRFHPTHTSPTTDQSRDRPGAHPPLGDGAPTGTLTGLFGDVWEWTASPYVAYPGYRPPPGALGEYNGKFMSNQMVLRGGSCATPQSHLRPTYRNFFPPTARWQFSGLRLAEDG